MPLEAWGLLLLPRGCFVGVVPYLDELFVEGLVISPISLSYSSAIFLRLPEIGFELDSPE